MRWKRRGFRRGTFVNPRKSQTAEPLGNKKTLPTSWEEFFEKIVPLLRPDFRGNIIGLSEVYQSFSKEHKKNLTDKIAGQILYAHSDIVKDVLKRLSTISLDLSQQTEVAYRRLKLVDRFF